MRREDLWTEARAKALDIVRQSTPADELAILTFDRSPRTLVSFQDWTSTAVNNRRALAEQRLAALKPTWNSTHLGNALLGAVETFEGERDKSLANRRIIIISDMQDGARLDGLQGFPFVLPACAIRSYEDPSGSRTTVRTSSGEWIIHFARFGLVMVRRQP